jgi:hypothetical protein
MTQPLQEGRECASISGAPSGGPRDTIKLRGPPEPSRPSGPREGRRGRRTPAGYGQTRGLDDPQPNPPPPPGGARAQFNDRMLVGPPKGGLEIRSLGPERSPAYEALKVAKCLVI